MYIYMIIYTYILYVYIYAYTYIIYIYAYTHISINFDNENSPFPNCERSWLPMSPWLWPPFRQALLLRHVRIQLALAA